MVQVFNAPRSRAGVLSEAFGQGLNKFMEERQKQQQQSQLANLLFGEEQAAQYGGLPPEQQLKAAELQQMQGVYGQYQQILDRIAKGMPERKTNEIGQQPESEQDDFDRTEVTY